MDANLKRKLARVVAILAVALGAGQLMQSLSHPDQAAQVARSETAQKAKDLDPLAAGNEATAAAALRLASIALVVAGIIGLKITARPKP